uniref:Leucine rich repeat containing protein 71 n=1 Tax=Echinococcus granulosus TaxID=6210 RepID=A0A068WBP4_ECHGR|nr:leucine rich repeat containing protein 71 [Echinococcus granulosus]
MENKSETPDQSQIVQYLNYKRMGHGCLQAAAQVSNVGNDLVFLDLSGNRLGDEGICNLAKILRINRTIKAISLSNNCLSDIGIEALCEVVTVFTLTPEEVAMRRLLKMKVFLDSKGILDAVHARLSLENDTSSLRQTAVSADRKHQNPKKGPLRKVKAQNKGKERHQTNRKDSKVNKSLMPIEKESQISKEKDYASSDPLLANEEGEGPFGMRIRGNYQLAMLNLSRNLITDFGVGLLSKALSIQTSSLIEGNFTGGPGLTDILLKGNKFDETGRFYENLLAELRRKRELFGKQPWKTDEGIKSEAQVTFNCSVSLNYTRFFVSPTHAQEEDRTEEEVRKE